MVKYVKMWYNIGTMNWSVSSGKDGVIQRSYFLAFGDSQDHSGAYPLADVTAAGNRWVQKISLWIFRSSGIWRPDDTNQTDLPSATATLVNNQHDYSLPPANFELRRVEVKDSSGNWFPLVQLSLREIDQAVPDFFQTAGLPKYFWLKGNSLFLHPAPDNGVSVTLSGGIRIYFTRKYATFTVPASYTTADTTTPGFDEQFHDTVAKGIALDWCIANGPPERAKSLQDAINSDMQDLFNHYGYKNPDKPMGIRPMKQIYR